MSYQQYSNLQKLDYIFCNDEITSQQQNVFYPITENNNLKVDKKLPQPRQRVKENSRLLPKQAIEIMTEWYDRNYHNPYPTYRDCEILAQRGSITINQVKQWFVNVRRRTQNEFRKTRDSKCSKRKIQEEPIDTRIVKKCKQETSFENINEVSSFDEYSYSSLSFPPFLKMNHH